MKRRYGGWPVIWLIGCSVLNAAPLQKYTYWIEPCERQESNCQANDPQLAAWALEAWQRAAREAIEFTAVNHREHARIRLYWGSSDQGRYGEARPILVDGKKGAEVYVRPAPHGRQDDKLLRDTVVYLTCLHETGHALGLPHTAAFADIMYNFQFGGDITEYFARYRRKLRVREDIRKNPGLSPADRESLLQVADEHQ